MQKVVEDVGKDADFNSGAWVSATNYVNAFGGTVTGCLGDIDNFLKKEKLEQVVAIVKSRSPNALGDLNVTLKDLSGTVRGTIHYKVLDVGSYEKAMDDGGSVDVEMDEGHRADKGVFVNEYSVKTLRLED
nr:transposase, MuDR, MULE transposase domain protein [Tanacetum cinerariifolium]